MNLLSYIGYALLCAVAAYNILLLRDCHAVDGLRFTIAFLVIYLFGITKLDDINFLGGDSNLVKNPFEPTEVIHAAAFTCTFLLVTMGIGTIDMNIGGMWNYIAHLLQLVISSVATWAFTRLYIGLFNVSDTVVQFLKDLSSFTIILSIGVSLMIIPSYLGIVYDNYAVKDYHEAADTEPLKVVAEVSIGAMLLLGYSMLIYLMRCDTDFIVLRWCPCKRQNKLRLRNEISPEPTSIMSPTRPRTASLVVELQHQMAALSDDQRDNVVITTFEKLEQLIKLSRAGLAFNMYQFVICVLSCLHYLWWTTIAYAPEYPLTIPYQWGSECGREAPDFNIYFRLHYFFIYNFCLDFAVNFFASSNKAGYIWNVTSITDILSIVPLAAFVFREMLTELDGLVVMQSPRLLDAFNCLRFLRLYKFAPNLVRFYYDWVSKNRVTDAWKKVGSNILFMAFQIIALLFCTSGTLFAVEFNLSDPYHDFNNLLRCVYFTVVTLSTVGYGDFILSTDSSRLTVTVMIICGIAIVPFQARRLMDSLTVAKQKGTWQAPYIPVPGFSHVVICGHVTMSTLNGLVDELLHEDHDLVLKVVLISPDAPSESVQASLSTGRFANRIVYLKSPVLNWETLKAAHVQTALACVVYHSQGKSNRERDIASIYNIITLKKYRNQNKQSGIPTLIIAETTMPENKHRLEAAGADIVLCFSSMRCQLLGRSLITPGLSTIVCNLLASGADEGAEVEIVAEGKRFRSNLEWSQSRNKWKKLKAISKSTQMFNNPPSAKQQQNDDFNEREVSPTAASDTDGTPIRSTNTKIKLKGIYSTKSNVRKSLKKQYPKSIWLEQYTAGMQHEVYRVKLSSSFHGIPFSAAVESVYRDLGIMMFAIQRRKRYNSSDITTSGGSTTKLFPGKKFIIAEGDYVYVMAEDAKECRRLSEDSAYKTLLHTLTKSAADTIATASETDTLSPLNTDAQQQPLLKRNNNNNNNNINMTMGKDKKNMMLKATMDVTKLEAQRLVKEAGILRASEGGRKNTLMNLFQDGCDSKGCKNNEKVDKLKDNSMLNTRIPEMSAEADADGSGNMITATNNHEKQIPEQTKTLRNTNGNRTSSSLSIDTTTNTSRTSMRHNYRTNVIKSNNRRKTVANLTNHWVICVNNFKQVHLEALIPLSCSHLHDKKIVILTITIDEDIAVEVEKIPQIVLIMTNNAFDSQDLSRVSIDSCHRVLILSTGACTSNATKNSEADMQALFLWLSIKDKVSKHIIIMVEIRISGSLRYVDPTSWWPIKMTRRTQYFAPTYAAGRSLVPSSLELMIAQAIFNPTNIECLQILMCSTKLSNPSNYDFTTPLPSPRDDGGSRKVPNNTAFIPPLDSTGSSSSSSDGSPFSIKTGTATHIFLVKVPKVFIKHTFGEMLSVLTLAHDILPLALYCGTGCGKGNALPFVYTNPKSDTMLFAKDKVYVLASSSEYANHVCDEVQLDHDILRYYSDVSPAGADPKKEISGRSSSDERKISRGISKIFRSSKLQKSLSSKRLSKQYGNEPHLPIITPVMDVLARDISTTGVNTNHTEAGVVMLSNKPATTDVLVGKGDDVALKEEEVETSAIDRNVESMENDISKMERISSYNNKIRRLSRSSLGI